MLLINYWICSGNITSQEDCISLHISISYCVILYRYFPTLNHLSLVSCTLITDKSMTQLLPCELVTYMFKSLLPCCYYM